jgi:hypothetical protein
MAAGSHPDSRLSSSDSRPIVVTLVAVGFFLICGLGSLNAFVVLVNGSSRVMLMESSPERAVESLEFGNGRVMGEVRSPEWIDVDRLFAAVYIAVGISGITGAVGLLRRRSWSRALLWATAGCAVGAHALYALRVLQIQTAEIANVFERQEIFELAGAASLINVAVQSIPLAILAGLLRHPALREYVFGASDLPAS